MWRLNQPTFVILTIKDELISHRRKYWFFCPNRPAAETLTVSCQFLNHHLEMEQRRTVHAQMRFWIFFEDYDFFFFSSICQFRKLISWAWDTLRLSSSHTPARRLELSSHCSNPHTFVAFSFHSSPDKTCLSSSQLVDLYSPFSIPPSSPIFFHSVILSIFLTCLFVFSALRCRFLLPFLPSQSLRQ